MMKKKPVLTFTIITFLVSFIIYLLTLAPDLNFTDAGELAGVCATLGIAHPTGYPLFAILGYFWTHIPLPFTKIYMMNLFAAITTAISVAIFFKIVLLLQNYVSLITRKQKSSKKQKQQSQPEKLTDTKPQLPEILIAFAASLLYALSGVVWSISNSIEVYSLESLLMTLILFTFLKAIFITEKTSRYFILAAFFLGLGFSNHMTTMLILPAILFLYFKKPGESFDFSKPNVKHLFILLIPFLAGLSFHIYLPLRAAEMPVFNWGWVSRSWDKYIYHITGKQYQVWMFTGLDAFSANLTKFFNLVPYQLAWAGLFPFVYGLYRAWVASKEIFWFILLIILGCLAYSLNYSIHDIETYFLAAVMGMVLFTGIGLYGIFEKFPKIYPAFFLLPLVSLTINFNENNESNNLLVPEYTRIMCENLRPNALIISSEWDYFCSAFWYKQQVEGYRKDIVIVEKELLRRTWYLEQFRRWYPDVAKKSQTELKSFDEQLERFEAGEGYSPELIQQRYITLLNSFIDYNYGKRPIYLTLEILQNQQDAGVGDGYQKIPEGFAFRLEKEKKVYPVNVDHIWVDNFIKGARGKDDHLVNGIKQLVSVCISNIGNYALMTSQIETARNAYKLSYRVDPQNSEAVQGLQKLGVR